MARIRNPQAYAAWLARKQMAQTQQQNVSAYEQGGVDSQTRQQLAQELAQQSITDVSGSTDNSGSIFGGKSPFVNDRSLFEGNIFK
jgi:hypothetical protein